MRTPAARYLGRLCLRGHNDGGGSIRFSSNYACVRCNDEFNASRESTAESSHKWRAVNSERIKAYAARYIKENAARRAFWQRTRDARKLQAMPAWADKQAMKKLYDEARRITKETGVPHEVDHVVPLRHPLVSGLHVPANLQVIPALLNHKKNNKFEITA